MTDRRCLLYVSQLVVGVCYSLTASSKVDVSLLRSEVIDRSLSRFAD